jgi:hypothetical protein
MNFFALSQAPPAFALDKAIETPLTRAPGNNPAIAYGPKKNPIVNGVNKTNNPGAIISYKAALVETPIHY